MASRGHSKSKDVAVKTENNNLTQLYSKPEETKQWINSLCYLDNVACDNNKGEGMIGKISLMLSSMLK